MICPNFDIVDCLLAAYAKVNGHSVLTFDNDLKKELAEQQYML
jgi:predicted nucleic acid-binding protein